MAKTPRRIVQDLFESWLKAVASGLPVSAKAHASTLLDTMKYLGEKPKWTGREQTFFMNWCEREGLIPKLPDNSGSER